MVTMEENSMGFYVKDKEEKVLAEFVREGLLERKEKEKIEVYTELKYDILKCWSNEVKTVIIIPVVIRAPGMVPKNLESYLTNIVFAPGIDPLQKTCLLGTVRILREVLDYQQ